MQADPIARRGRGLELLRSDAKRRGSPAIGSHDEIHVRIPVNRDRGDAIDHDLDRPHQRDPCGRLAVHGSPP